MSSRIPSSGALSAVKSCGSSGLTVTGYVVCAEVDTGFVTLFVTSEVFVSVLLVCEESLAKVWLSELLVTRSRFAAFAVELPVSAASAAVASSFGFRSATTSGVIGVLSAFGANYVVYNPVLIAFLTSSETS